MKIQKLHESYAEEEAGAFATLLTAEEANKLPDRLRKYSNFWWLQSPGVSSHNATVVDLDDFIFLNGHKVDYANYAVRPALKIQNLNQPIGTKFQFGDRTFEVIDDDTAFCLGDIGKHYFNKKRTQGNKYDTSDIKKYVDAWFEKAWKEAIGE